MSHKSHLWIMLVSLAVGIACVLLNKIAPETIVIILGTTFIATGALNLAAIFGVRNKGEKLSSVSGLFTSLASAALGTWLIIAPEDNVALITRIISIFVILASGYLLLSMLVYFRNIRFHSAFYILPSAIFAVGVWMLISPMTFASFLVLLVGIILIIYAISLGMELLAIKAYERRIKKSASKFVDIDDVPYTDIKELE